MSDEWAEFLVFNIQAALVSCLVSFLGILLLLKLFRIDNPKVRIAFLGVALMRPLVVFLDYGGHINEPSRYNVAAGMRLPDILNSLPVRVLSHEPSDFAFTDYNLPIDHLIARVMIGLGFVVILLILFRWLSLLILKRRVCRDALGPDEPESRKLTALVRELSQELGLTRPPETIVIRGGWGTPFTFGCVKHTLFAGAGLIREIDADDLKAIAAHELAHIKRRDNLRHGITVVIRDIQFFNPFSYLSISRMNLEREVACDRVAVSVTRISPERFAACLVGISRRALSVRARPFPEYGLTGFLTGNKNLLEKRVACLISLTEPGGGTEAGRLQRRMKGAALVALWLLMVIPQFYIYVWFGDYVLTIR